MDCFHIDVFLPHLSLFAKLSLFFSPNTVLQHPYLFFHKYGAVHIQGDEEKRS